MREHPDSGPGTPSVGAGAWDGEVGYVTSEDVAFAAELAELDRADRESGDCYDADLEVPPAWDGVEPCDDDLVAALAARVSAADLLLLDSIDPGSLSENLNRVDYLRALDRVAGFVAAKRHGVIVAMVGATSSEAYLPEVHLEHELAVAALTSRYAAGRAIEVARALATTFPGFATALRAGEVTELHCRILVEKTRVVAEESVLAEIERRVLPKAQRMPAGEFGGEVAKVLARLDRDAAQRAKKARATRRVWSRQLEDGMGYPGLTHDWPTIQAMADTIATSGRCVQVARGGTGAVADYARFATWWRRLVTDPVDGHLLDYGTATYLPETLRRFVLARDGGCRNPSCTTRAASRMQMDHAEEFPTGSSDTANCGALCTTCHQLKTAGHADITSSAPDGSCDWTTAWGQTIHVPPRSVLPTEPDPPPAVPAPPTSEDPPPF